MTKMIKCLPGEVQAKLRSGVAMVSLQQCVEELLLNAIDAQASCVAVRLDLDGCKVQVLDNGLGMDRDDMERVGNRYFTSKCSTLEDLENLRFYGFRGEAIASIASLSTLMEISSRPKLSVKTFVKVFREGEALNVFEAETGRPSSGTTVVICNFFHGMPVRRKRMDPVLECERIRQRVEAISLMHPSVSFTLKKDCSGAMVVQIPKARDTYHRFTQIHGIGRAQKLGEVNFCHGQFQMSGYIGREGHYNNSFQFLFVNKRLVLKTPIHKLLNLLLKKVCSVSQLNGSSGVSHVLGSPKQRLGPELHGVYVINIEYHYSEYDVCYEPAKTLIEFKDWDSVLFCVEEGVKKFLTTENLITEISPEDIQDGFGGPVNPCSAMPCITRECYEGKLLASKAVCRRFTDNPNKTEEVSSINERADYSRAIETDKSNVEAARTMEQKCQPASTSVPYVPVIEKDVSPAQSASEIKQDLPSGAEFCTVLNTFGAVGEPSGGEEAESRDWQEHFDTSVGKLSYVNRVTGMSKYEAPDVEDTQVYCVKDVTTMAVSVMSRNGFEYRCYPFQTELVLPFLPRSRAERVLSTGSDNTEAHQGASSLYSLYSDWENPVFVRPPEVALNVTSAQAEGLAVKIHNVLYPYRFTKDMISSMKAR
ncbi:DNA mismatch repair protein Mlh3-like, partial [Scleropages formosus]